MNEQSSLRDNNYIMETALFIASSIREVIKWKQYGTLRLSQTFIKILNISNEIESLKRDEFLENIKNDFEKNMHLRLDEQKYEEFLDDLIIRMLIEYKKRLG